MFPILVADDVPPDGQATTISWRPLLSALGLATTRGASARSPNAMSWLWMGLKTLCGFLGDVAVAGVYASGIILLGMSLWHRLSPASTATVATMPRRGPALVS